MASHCFMRSPALVRLMLATAPFQPAVRSGPIPIGALAVGVRLELTGSGHGQS